FLFGMNVMGDGLEKRGGGSLKSILENLTSNRFKGVALGALVTAVIQSSSATTVMVVGFVNSGLMTLSQSIGIIMGANIGTTITAWILSLAGIEGDSFGMMMLKPENFSLIFATIGIVLSFSKKEKHKDVGNILLGFTVLMYGMKMMSGAVAPLKESEAFCNILIMFSNPILGILVGAGLTAIIQSSSASVGILQALCSTGAVRYSNAIPIIMGQNIGTCVTAAISAIGANKNAKRVAVVHLSFNVIGTLVFLVLFYSIQYTIGFGFYESEMDPAKIATVHTIFNIFATVLLIPFTKQLEKLANFIIKDKNNAGETQLLDERLLETPTVAVQQAQRVTTQMMHTSVEALDKSLAMLENGYTESTAEEIQELENQVDMYEDKLGTYLVKLSHHHLNYDDSHKVSNLLHTIGDFERMSDHAVNLSDSAKEIHEKKVEFSEEGRKELRIMAGAIKDILALTAEAYEKQDLELAQQIEPLEQVVDRLKYKLKKGHIARLQQNNCTIETGFVFNDLITNFERIADHCSNIAVCMIEVSHDSFDTHEFLHKFHHNQNFEEKVKELEAKYSL
ncbi:MAG: Na/Pi cotransporter family protein, partial [Clostridia bacterium]|nr:Na/Pi cotransporter family protein [Clostridia bacterium]